MATDYRARMRGRGCWTSVVVATMLLACTSAPATGLTPTGTASDTPTVETPPSALPPAGISGRVSTASTSLSGIEVSLWRADDPLCADKDDLYVRQRTLSPDERRRFATCTQPAARITTDTQGCYTFTDVPPGDYYLTLSLSWTAGDRRFTSSFAPQQAGEQRRVGQWNVVFGIGHNFGADHAPTNTGYVLSARSDSVPVASDNTYTLDFAYR